MNAFADLWDITDLILCQKRYLSEIDSRRGDCILFARQIKMYSHMARSTGSTALTPLFL